MIQTLQPENEAAWLEMRQVDITSTAVSALFGCNPYLSRRELWEQKKKNFRVEITPNEKMKWGNALQDVIAETVAKEKGWKIRKMTEYVRDTDLRLGASFDFAIDDDGIQEIKTVGENAFRDGWLETIDGLEAPLNYEFQIQLQLLLSGRKYAYLCALVGGQRLVVARREPDEHVHNRIRDEAKKFWQSVEDNNPPEFQFPKDNALVAKLYGYAEPGSVMEADDDIAKIAKEYKRVSDIITQAQEIKDRCKAELLVKCGEAEKVLGKDFTISSGMVSEAEISYKRQAYRNFRINWRKAKS